MPTSKTPLTDALEDLRSQLLAATARTDGEMKLAVEGLEVELTLEMSTEGEGSTEFSFWTIASAKARFGFKRNRTHRILLKLRPEWLEESPDGTQTRKPMDLRNKRPYKPEQ